jgi:hypothetical protein
MIQDGTDLIFKIFSYNAHFFRVDDQPNHRRSGVDQYCVGLAAKSDNITRLNDLPCTTGKPYICEVIK